MSGDVLCGAHGHVRLIALGRPAKMNSPDFEANDALVERKRGVPGTQARPGSSRAETLAVTGAGTRIRTAQAASLRRESSTRTCCGASIVRTMSRPLYDCTSKNWRT